MSHPHSSQHDNFLAAVGLLVVAALASAFMGSFAGVIAIAALIGVLGTRAQWARIVTLVIVAYVGFVSLLVALFARGGSSLAALIATVIAAAIFWLLLRPGMSEYFSSRESLNGRANLRSAVGTDQRSVRPQIMHSATRSPAGAGSTHEQWARLQQQLRAERAREEQEAAAFEKNSSELRTSFPWLTMIFAVMVFADAAAIGGDFGRASMLLVVPGFIAAMVRWIPPRGFFFAVLILSGWLMLRPDSQIVAPGINALLQHHGPMVFAAIALLAYMVALCVSGFAGDCENHV